MERLSRFDIGFTVEPVVESDHRLGKGTLEKESGQEEGDKKKPVKGMPELFHSHKG